MEEGRCISFFFFTWEMAWKYQMKAKYIKILKFSHCDTVTVIFYKIKIVKHVYHHSFWAKIIHFDTRGVVFGSNLKICSFSCKNILRSCSDSLVMAVSLRNKLRNAMLQLLQWTIQWNRIRVPSGLFVYISIYSISMWWAKLTWKTHIKYLNQWDCIFLGVIITI